LIVCESSAFSSASVAFFVMNWSRPTSATVLPGRDDGRPAGQ
jgi:hypothetical protein